jgi:hypothetical protein
MSNNKTDIFIAEQRTLSLQIVGKFISMLDFLYLGTNEGTGRMPKVEYKDQVLPRLILVTESFVWCTNDLRAALRPVCEYFLDFESYNHNSEAHPNPYGHLANDLKALKEQYFVELKNIEHTAAFLAQV